MFPADQDAGGSANGGSGGSDERQAAYKLDRARTPKDQWKKAVIALNAARRFRAAGGKLSGTQRRRASSAGGGQSPEKPKQEGPGFTRTTSAQGGNDVELGANGAFAITADELVDLLSLPCEIENVEKHGGPLLVAKKLNVDPKRGIANDEAEITKRIDAFGDNVIPSPPRKLFWEYIVDACKDVTLIILFFCAIASLIAGLAAEGLEEGWYDGVSISVAIIVVVLIVAINDYQQDLQFRELDAKTKDIVVHVTRGGAAFDISVSNIVVGDIVNLSTGDQIPADGLVISSQSLELDESSMTGESDLMKKDVHKNPFLLCGTKVTDGFGTMIVTGVGLNTEWGKLMSVDSSANEKALESLDEQLSQGAITQEEYDGKKEKLALDEDEDETPLQIRLNDMATKIGKVGLLVACVVLLVRIAKFLVAKYGNAEDDYGHGDSDMQILVHDISIAVTIVVVAVPEGLPLAVTLSLAFSMKRMYKDNSLVRRLKACEAMGGATTICSDKTGTLTTNRMTVVKAWMAGSLFANQEKDCSDVKTKAPEGVVTRLVDSVCMNSEVQLSTDEAGLPQYTGKPTEIALVKYALQLGGTLEAVRSKYSVLRVDPFNSAKKKMGTLCRDTQGRYFVFWKGASEILLEKCTHVDTVDSSAKPLSAEARKDLMDMIKQMAGETLRTICVAYKEVSPGLVNKLDLENDDIPDDGLICLSIAGIKDPCRPGVPLAVSKCQKAGIVVRMVTGDNVMTASAIARECNILTEGGLAVEGKEFRKMTYSERIKRFGQKLEKLQVMARSSPTDKFDLVHMLRTLGEVVAVTGDGTNDAKALREADIGCSMGIAGTEVAKQSSDIVILDDNFTTIVTMVRWGRCIYNNIQKFIAFQLTVNVVALTINFVGAVVPGAEPPFSPVQLLWVNMIMDSMGALALGTEGPSEELMQKKPYGRTDPLITAVMWRNILCQAAFQLIVLFIFLFEGDTLFNLNKNIEQELTKLNTIIFNTFVFCQIFNEMNSRDLVKINIWKGFFGNTLFVSVIVISAFFQVIIVEYFGRGAKVTPLTWDEWLISVGIAMITLPIGVFVKLVPASEKGVLQLWTEGTSGDGSSKVLMSDYETRIKDLETEVEELRAKMEQILNLRGLRSLKSPDSDSDLQGANR